MKIMFTTGEVAHLLNTWSNAPNGYSSDFVLGEIDDHRLVARVHSSLTGRRRRRIRVHVDDLMVYMTAHHPRLVAEAKRHFASVEGASL